MDLGRLVKTAVVVGIVINVFDYIVHEMLLQSWYATMPFMRVEDPSMVWLIVGDFVWALVFVWVWDKVRGSFGENLNGGLRFGFYAGVLMNFPLWIFMHLFVEGMSYSTGWVWTGLGIVSALIMGAVAGSMYGRAASAPAAAAM